MPTFVSMKWRGYVHNHDHFLPTSMTQLNTNESRAMINDFCLILRLRKWVLLVKSAPFFIQWFDAIWMLAPVQPKRISPTAVRFLNCFKWQWFVIRMRIAWYLTSLQTDEISRTKEKQTQMFELWFNPTVTLDLLSKRIARNFFHPVRLDCL